MSWVDALCPKFVRSREVLDCQEPVLDGDRESLWLEGGTKGVMSGLGFHPTIVERPRNKLEAIAAARAAFARCQFESRAAILGCVGFGRTGRSGTRAGGCGRTGPGMMTPRTGPTPS